MGKIPTACARNVREMVHPSMRPLGQDILNPDPTQLILHKLLAPLAAW